MQGGGGHSVESEGFDKNQVGLLRVGGVCRIPHLLLIIVIFSVF